MSDLISRSELVEEWKDIEGYEGLYQVSNFGKIKSIPRYRKNNGNSQTLVKEKILKQSVSNRGYARVELSKDSLRKPYSVHRLVAQAFIPNPYSLPEVNHKDENKLNNNADNLEWVTTKDNVNHGTHNERVALANGSAVQAFNNSGELVMEFSSMSEAERKTGVYQQNISRCISGKCKQAGGYIWRRKDIVRGGRE